MDDGALKTLFLPLETGDVAVGEGKWLFIGADVPPFDCPVAKPNLHAVQGFRPTFNLLTASKLNVTPTVPDGEFSGALILLSRHRGQNRAFLNQALDRVRAGGAILVSGAKTDGIAPIAKEISELFAISGNVSKNHAKVFWFENQGSARFEEPEEALVDGRFVTAHGMFSSQHIDPGSAFLVEHLPADMKGNIADFCAGWGYLAAEAALKCKALKSIALYEADYASLEAAKINMLNIAPAMPTTYLWQDLIGEKAKGDFDTIIMNPPFHQGRAADAGIGNAIIRNAHNALHKGGKLYLVANRALPYEATLNACFFKTGELARNNYYKVLWATK
jgi:16S rRNA (guanine1207-N2)-methyltransferase